ncbi:MAG: hypothetical protein V1866_03540 [archaeon]
MIEIDEYDPFCIHLAGFHIINDEKKLVCGARIITSEEQSQKRDVLEKIVKTRGDRIAIESLHRARNHTYAIQNDYDAEINEFLKQRPSAKFAEFSRLTVDGNYQGAGISRNLVQFVQGYARFFLNMDYGFVICWNEHVNLNIDKYKFSGIIPGAKTVVSEQVKINRSIGLYVNLSSFDNPLNDRYNKQVHAAMERIKNEGKFCCCNLVRECAENNYAMINQAGCPAQKGG